MNKEFQDLRKDYVRGDLSLERLDADPLAQLDQWLRDALEAGAVEPTAMALSTVTPSGAPHSRMVLLKGLEKDGLVFYTNYNSDKGKAIESNPQVSVLFFWPLLERQVRVEGVAQKVAPEVSDAYFASRPRESRLGALASPQSSVVESYEYLEKTWLKLKEEYEGKEVPRPANWGGYIIKPHIFEFWQGGHGRLHKRFRYKWEDGNWIIETLAP